MLLRKESFGDFFTVEPLNIKVNAIAKDPKYASYEWKGSCGRSAIYDKTAFGLYVLRNENVAYISDEEKTIWLEKTAWDLRDMISEKRKRVYALYRKRDAQKYLSSSFAKSWLKKMRYTVKESETGTKYLFLSILPGYNKISNKSFQKLCHSINDANFKSEFSMGVWIGGKVDWTMFYEQPFGHVNGRETYFCGGVAEDNYSPDDWERDMANLKTKLGHPVSQKEYINFLFKKGK